MATPTIPNGEEQFFPIIYEGNGGAQRVGKFVPFTDNGTIANSVIFNDADNAYVSKTFGTPTNNKKWTFSAWVKLGVLGTNRALISSNINGAEYFDLFFTTGNVLKAQNRISSSNDLLSSTSRTFEDTSKFYHFLIVYDSDNSTSADRYIVYVDGDRLTVDDEAGSGVASAFNKSGVQHQVGISNTLGSSGVAGLGYQFDGYMAEVNFVDGSALTPDTFGLTDTSTGRWIPKALTGITYGNNGFRLQFASSSALGDDTSGNTNDFSVTNLVAGDQTTDSPTQNHATLNANPTASGGTLSEGNLKLVTNNTGYNVKYATLKPTSGKYYAEFTIGSGGAAIIGVQDANVLNTATSSYFPYGYGYGWYEGNGNVYDENVAVVLSGTSYTSGDVIAMALDLDNQILKWYKNNSLAYTVGLNGTDIVMAVGDYANADDATITCNFGQKSFTYTPPTGFVALQQDNLPETDRGVTGMSWTKDRDNGSYNHELYDSSRGPFQELRPNATTAENTRPQALSKFLKGGFAVGDRTGMNSAGNSYVSWNWVANGGTTASNSNGSITSTTQVNSEAGFSIVQYTGNRTSGATIGHGLSQAPEVIITKNLDASYNWIIYFKQQGANKYGYLNLTNTWVTDTTGFNNVEPTSTVFTVGSAYESNGTHSMIAYCWHSVAGYSKMGNYIGTGSNPGPFIYTGFKPRFIIHKGIDIVSNGRMIDSVRNPFNPVTQELYTDTTVVEYNMGARGTDFLSNGFKIRQESGYGMNNSGINYFYMAFAEHPFVGDGTNPVTAR